MRNEQRDRPQVAHELHKRSLKVARKRRDAARRREFKVTDVQLVVCAALTAAYCGTRVAVLTQDEDVVDLAATFMMTALEKHVITSAVADKLAVIPSGDGIPVDLQYSALQGRFRDALRRLVRDSATAAEFVIIYWRREDDRLYPDAHKLPGWFRDFLLEFKQGVDCYSIPDALDLQYPFKWLGSTPDLSSDRLTVKVWKRASPFYPGLMADCEARCIYPMLERTAPERLSDWVPQDGE